MRGRESLTSQKGRVKYIWLSFLALVIFCGEGRCEEVSKVIARVNDEVITSKDLDAYLKVIQYQNSSLEKTSPLWQSRKEMKERVIWSLIEDKLILLKAKQEKIDVPQDWVEQRLNRIISSFPSYKEFEQSLIKEGLTLNLMREKIREQFLIRKVIEKNVISKINITPRQITDYYNKNISRFTLPVRFVYWVVKSPQREVILDIADKIEKEGWEITKQSYKELFFKVEGDKKKLRKEILEVVENLNMGKFKIKKLDNFYYLICLERVIPPQPIPLDEAKEEIYSALWKDEFKKTFRVWIDGLKKEAVIKIYQD